METQDETKDKFLKTYLEFKKECIKSNLFSGDEIIKLFEVWLNLLN